jgi:peptidyl-prolyl cis-trans isomerase C
MTESGKLFALAALLGVLLAACGEKKAEVPAAMKVNGEPISVAEMEHRLERFGQSARRGHTVTGKMIKMMIDKELLRQAALRERLDEDPRVHASLAEANRMILASAYMEKQIAAIPQPSEAEVKDYFNQHPERFADRKVYTLQELTIQASPDTAAEIKEKLGAGSNYDEFLRWLEGKKITSQSQEIVTSSERMREEVAKKFQGAKLGEAITLADNNQLSVLFITAIQSQPLTLEQAAPMIKSFIYNKSISERTENAIKQLREKAKIEYVPPYTEHGIPQAVEE